MIDIRIMQRALIVGTVLQVALAMLSHVSPWVQQNVLLFGAMMISATSGYLYAMDYGAGLGAVGVLAMILLKDEAARIFVLWTGIFTLTGIAGGFWGEVAARMRR